MIWNLSIKRGPDGSKHLDVQIHGVIDGGWLDENPVNTADLIGELNTHSDAKTIGVRLNSVGGSLFGGVAVYNALQAHAGEVTCYVEGLAASAASLIAMAGKCVMGLGAMLMIHKPSTVAMGNADDMRKAASMLDTAQAALATIYTAKTGKSLDDINAMLDEETWMTADEAVAAGFADSIGEEPDGDETGGKSDGDGDEPKDIGAAVLWNGVQFPKSSLPAQIVAMAKAPEAVRSKFACAVVSSDKGEPESLDILLPITDPKSIALACEQLRAVAPLLHAAIAETAAPVAILNRAYLAEKAPALLAELLAEGRTAGATAERERLRAIDDLQHFGLVDVVRAAKYGEQTMEAGALAIAINKAASGPGHNLIAARAAESAAIATIQPSAPDASGAAEHSRVVAAIAAGGNARRGARQ